MNAHETFEPPIGPSTAAIYQQIESSKRAQQQWVGWIFANELPARESSIENPGRICSKTRIPGRILRHLTSNLLKRFAEYKLTRNRVFDDEYRSTDLVAAG